MTPIIFWRRRQMTLKQNIMRLLGIAMAAGLMVAACQPAATAVPPTTAATSAPTTAAATEAPTTAPATEAPTTAPATEAPTAAPAYEGMKKAADDCTYGGEFKSIEAVDEFTVKFSLCVPDPAFLSKVAFG